MDDTIVLGRESVPPLQLQTASLLDQWASWKADLLASGITMKLFVNDITIAASTELTALIEADSPGYAPFAITVLNGPALDGAGNAYMTTNQAFFVTTGGGDDLCYGAYVVLDTGAAATATFTLVGGAYTLPVVTSGGSGYLVPPKVTVTGDDGTGAVLEAVLTDGVVTSITIVSPGVDYTTATATIEQPNRLIAAGNFDTPRPLQVATDAIPVVVEFDNLAA